MLQELRCPLLASLPLARGQPGPPEPGEVPVLEGGSVVSQDYSRDVPSPKEALEGGWGKRLRESSFLQSHVCSQAAAPQDIQQVSNLKEEKPALFCCPSGCVISLERLIS